MLNLRRRLRPVRPLQTSLNHQTTPLSRPRQPKPREPTQKRSPRCPVHPMAPRKFLKLLNPIVVGDHARAAAPGFNHNRSSLQRLRAGVLLEATIHHRCLWSPRRHVVDESAFQRGGARALLAMALISWHLGRADVIRPPQKLTMPDLASPRNRSVDSFSPSSLKRISAAKTFRPRPSAGLRFNAHHRHHLPRR